MDRTILPISLDQTTTRSTILSIRIEDIQRYIAKENQMSPSELQQQLIALDPTGKAEAIQLLTRHLSSGSQGVNKTPNVMGGDACIANTRIPVWLFVSLRQQGANDAELLENHPQLTAADLVNVWAYADAHPDEISTALREQEEA